MFVTASFLLLGCASNASPNIPSGLVITKQASNLVLLMSDFPLGWSKVNSSNSSGTSDATYTNSADTMRCIVQVYPDINSAHTAYTNNYAQNSNVKAVTSANIGNEAFGFRDIASMMGGATNTAFTIVFRQNNVFVVVTIEAATGNNLQLSDALYWANKVEAKIG